MQAAVDKSSSPAQVKVGWGIKLSFRPIISPLSNWKRRRFELTQTQFIYSAEDGTLKGTIPRSEFLLAEAIENHLLPHRRGHNVKFYPFAMRLWIGQSPFFICVATEQARKSWIDALNNSSSINPRCSFGGPRFNSTGITPQLSTQLSSSPPIQDLDSSQSIFQQIVKSQRLTKTESFSMSTSQIDLDSDDDSDIAFSFSEPVPEEINIYSSDHHFSFLSKRRKDTSCEESDIDIILFNALQKLLDSLNARQSMKFIEELDNGSSSISSNLDDNNWNDRFQNIMDKLFFVNTLPQFEEKCVFNEDKLTNLTELKQVRNEFTNAATEIFKGNFFFFILCSFSSYS